MTSILEREIKLKFAGPEEARAAILASGATLLRSRRLQEDCLLDSDDETLRRQRCVLRIRMEGGRSLITLKGPVQPSSMKVREELETVVADGELLLKIFEQMGFHVWFRYQKFREEFASADVIVAVDETPVGTYVEIEGTEQGIRDMAAALSRTPDQYVRDSYRGLFVRYCQDHGLPPGDMVFEDAETR